MKRLLSNLYSNTVLANCCLLLFVLSGLASTFFLTREEMPTIISDHVFVSVSYPGASPEEVEEAISIKIEEAIKGLEGIDTFTTISMEGISATYVKIKDAFDEYELLDRVRSNINDISTFPPEVETPVISLPDHSDVVTTIYLSGNLSEKALKEWAYQVKEELTKLHTISQVSVFGARPYQIDVQISEKKLRQYGMTFAQIATIIKKNNLTMSGGLIKTDLEDVRVRTVDSKLVGDSLSSIPILTHSSGASVSLGQIAHINDGFSDHGPKMTVNQRQAIVLGVFKTSQEDTIRIANTVRQYISNKQQTLPPGMTIDVLFDNSDSIRYLVNILIENGILGLAIVFVILWLFLDSRLSIWTGVGIVFTVFGGLAVLLLMGKTINMVSIFGFIMILGIVADDAIVIGESIAWNRQQGKGPIESIICGFQEVGLPVFIAVSTTIIAFIPLGFIAGDMGKFIRVLPIVVISCLLISLVESFLILPVHLNSSHQVSIQSQNSGLFGHLRQRVRQLMNWIVETIYLPVLKSALLWRYAFLSLILALLLVTVGLVQSGFLKYEMLPNRDGNFITANLEFPEGTSPKVTGLAIQRLEDSIVTLAEETKTASGDPLIERVLSVYGQSMESEPGEFGPTGNHLGGVRVYLLDERLRGIQTKELIPKWKDTIGQIPGLVSLSFSGVTMGHDGKPIQIAIDGQDLNQVNQAVDQLKRRLSEMEGVFGVQSDNTPGKTEIQYTLKPEARSLGLHASDLASQLSAAFYGEEVIRIQRGRENIQIKTRYTTEEQSRLYSLDQLRIRTPAGYEVPLATVADSHWKKGASKINRTDGLHRVLVSADVDPSIVYASQVTSDLGSTTFIDLKNRFPDIRIVLEGDAGETATSFNGMLVGFGFAIFAIYILIATLFRSYIQPLIILFTIPFGLIGAIWGHLIMGCDLTIISLFGMVGLTGIVVNDAIVFIEKVNQNLKVGLPFIEALTSAGARRFRAVVMTSITTIGGLSPLMFEPDSYAVTLRPMAVTIVFGVAFTTVLTLVFIPCLLSILNDFRAIGAPFFSSRLRIQTGAEPRPLSGQSQTFLNTSSSPRAQKVSQ